MFQDFRSVECRDLRKKYENILTFSLFNLIQKICLNLSLKDSYIFLLKKKVMSLFISLHNLVDQKRPFFYTFFCVLGQFKAI